MKSRLFLAGALGVTLGCGGGGGSPTGPTAPPVQVSPHLTAPAIDSPSDRQQLDTLRPTLTVRNGTSDQPGARAYEFEISDASDFSSSVTSQIPSFFNVVTTSDVVEGTDGKTSFTPSVELQPTTRFYWRARLVQGSTRSEWSATSRFNSRLVGFIRAGELYDPLIHGETVGTRVGNVQLITGKGARLVTHSSHIRYRLPATVRAGEFSMIVEGLRANAHGEKTKVFGMQEGLTDFIVNAYRVDAQFRGAPSNVINWRAIFGGEENQLDPTKAEREASVLMAKPEVPYLWRGTWGSGFRLEVLEGGLNGRIIYNRGKTIQEDYGANPHYAFLGAPVGRSGPESASIEGATYRNVWLGSRSRPASLGSALEN
jgi:hypothetical protein